LKSGVVLTLKLKVTLTRRHFSVVQKPSALLL
jgi:hypothetical protein